MGLEVTAHSSLGSIGSIGSMVRQNRMVEECDKAVADVIMNGEK